jgi:hypothetical protein
MLLFITAVPIIKLFARGIVKDMCYEIRRADGIREEPGTLQRVRLFSLVPLVWEFNPKLHGGWCKTELPAHRDLERKNAASKMSIFMHPNPSTLAKLCVTSRLLLDKWYGERARARERESLREKEREQDRTLLFIRKLLFIIRNGPQVISQPCSWPGEFPY